MRSLFVLLHWSDIVRPLHTDPRAGHPGDGGRQELGVLRPMVQADREAAAPRVPGHAGVSALAAPRGRLADIRIGDAALHRRGRRGQDHPRSEHEPGGGAVVAVRVC